MDRNILFITDRNSITTKALMAGLSTKGFFPMPTAAAYSAMPDAKDCPPVVFCCMQDWNVDRKYLYSEITRLVRDSGALLFLGGDRSLTDADGFVQSFRKENVEEIFFRPFNVDDIALRIDEALHKKTGDSAFAGTHDTEKPKQRRTILIVDDNPITLRTLKSALQDRFKVFLANSGVSALKLLDEHKPDLILLDYEMPVLNGPQFFKFLRARRQLQHIPVVFITGKSDRETVSEVMSLKPSGYLLKSTPIEEIIKKITECLHDDAP